MKKIVMLSIILLIPTVLFAELVDINTLTQKSKKDYCSQETKGSQQSVGEWYNQQSIAIEQAYQNKEITKYEYFDLKIKLEQCRLQILNSMATAVSLGAISNKH